MITRYLNASEMQLLKDLRNLQRQYFRTRSKYLLEKCIALEKKVDRILEKVNLPSQSKQSELGF